MIFCQSVYGGIFYHKIFTMSPEIQVLPVWASILLFPVVGRRRNHLRALSLNWYGREPQICAGISYLALLPEIRP